MRQLRQLSAQANSCSNSPASGQQHNSAASARTAQQQRHNSSNDGDDSRPLSPDKELKASSAFGPAETSYAKSPPAHRTHSTTSSTTKQQQQPRPHGPPKSRSSSSGQPRPPPPPQGGMLHRSYSLTNALLQHKNTTVGAGDMPPLVKGAPIRRSVQLPSSRQRQQQQQEQQLAAARPQSAQPTTTHSLLRSSATVVHTAPHMAAATGATATAAMHADAEQQDEQVQQQSALLPERSTFSSSCQSVSTESSGGSSIVSPHDQLLLAAAIDALHCTQQPHHQQHLQTAGHMQQLDAGSCSNSRSGSPQLQPLINAAGGEHSNSCSGSTSNHQRVRPVSLLQQPIPKLPDFRHSRSSSRSSSSGGGDDAAASPSCAAQLLSTEPSHSQIQSLQATVQQQPGGSLRVSQACSQAQLSAGVSLAASEFEAITRDVAARIIQTHWHAHQQRQQLLQQQQQVCQEQDLEQVCREQQQPVCEEDVQHQSEGLTALLRQQIGGGSPESMQHHLQQQEQEVEGNLTLQQLKEELQQQKQSLSAQSSSASSPSSSSQCVMNGQPAPHSRQHTDAAAQDMQPEVLLQKGEGCVEPTPAAAVEGTAAVEAVDGCARGDLQPPSAGMQIQFCTSSSSSSDNDGTAATSIQQQQEQEQQQQQLSAGAPQLQVCAAALGKLRATAGSRNAARLQQYTPAAAPPAAPPAAAPAAAGAEQCMQEAAATDCADTAETGLHAANSSTSNISTRPPQEQQQQRQVASTGGDKLSTILAYLDAVEASVEGDVGAGAHTRPGTSCLPPQGGSLLHSLTSSIRPQSAHTCVGTGSTHSMTLMTQQQPWAGQNRQQQSEPQVLMWDGAVQRYPAAAAMLPQGETSVASLSGRQGVGPPSAAAGGGDVMSGCTTAVSSRPAAMAESVFDGVKAKMRNLRAALASKEQVLQALTQEREVMQESHQQQLQALAAAHQQALAAAAAESSAALSRHLSIIDRLMEEKGQLAAKLDEAHMAAAAAEEHHSATVAALKQGWAAELKRQAANWEAAAAGKQEAWRMAKLAEIKEQTVKGLEVEVQRLIARHRSELEAAHDRAGEQVKAALEGQQAEQELKMQALKDKLRQQQEEAVERERSGAAARLHEASERWEAQLQAMRMRLVAEHDIKLEVAAAAVREEKRKGEAAVEAVAARAAAQESLAKEEWAREKEALGRCHARALESAKQAAADERTAWRAAVTEQLKRQAADREERLRAELLKQRDEQLEVVIRRLEAEGAAARAAAADKVAAEHATAMSALQEQLQQSQKGAKRLAERGKAAAAAAAATERQRLELEQQLDQARQELVVQHQALSVTKGALSAKEVEAASAASAAAASVASSTQQLQGDKARLEGRLQEVQEQLRQQRQQHEVEMQHVELRVKAAIARKDESVQQLQQQLAAALEALRGTEAVLEGLCD